MMNLRLLVICALVALLARVVRAQIAFVEDQDIDKKKANLAGRKPLYSPARCPKHQLLYPGDQQQQNDWVCDCAPATLYYPETDACYPAYRQGPCETGQMLVLYKEKIIPECVRNPCARDNYFMIRDTCYEFGNTNENPCPYKEATYVLGVNPMNLMVDCVKLSVHLDSRISDDSEAPPPEYHIELAEKCARGSRLLVQGKCA
ncbi:hypothetical protein KR018_007458 [Drosophila ironensis]|nr:hypothetical protein KR018_007458 [Drosophila ironensis]